MASSSQCPGPVPLDGHAPCGEVLSPLLLSAAVAMVLIIVEALKRLSLRCVRVLSSPEIG
jgi:hypothetical protein